jgi:hypothetical protein
VGEDERELGLADVNGGPRKSANSDAINAKNKRYRHWGRQLGTIYAGHSGTHERSGTGSTDSRESEENSAGNEVKANGAGQSLIQILHYSRALCPLEGLGTKSVAISVTLHRCTERWLPVVGKARDWILECLIRISYADEEGFALGSDLIRVIPPCKHAKGSLQLRIVRIWVNTEDFVVVWRHETRSLHQIIDEIA